MAKGNVHCIYCEKLVDPTVGEGDHIVPCGLGEFRNDVRFRRLCFQCNNRLSKAEQQFLQCGPESLFRAVVKPAVPRRRARGRSRLPAVDGVPSPQFTIDDGDHHQLVRPSADNPRVGHAIDQLVLEDSEGKSHFIQLYPGLRSDQLRDRIKKTGIKKIEKAWLHCGQSHWDEFTALFATLYPKSQMHHLPPTPAGMQTRQARIKITVNNDYFRVIAKIAFHYYLVHSRRKMRGDEPEFAGIREFIMNGGQRKEFFRASGRQIQVPFGKVDGGVLSPQNWCHLLAANEQASVAVGYVHLFLGPGCVPQSHYVTLGKIKSAIVGPSFAWAHRYAYDEPQQAEGFAGEVEEVTLNIFQIPS